MADSLKESRYHTKISCRWFLIAGALLAIYLQTTVASVVVTPFCENSTVTWKEKGSKELLSAVKNNRPQMVMVLTSKGLNINIKTDSGDSLLHVSVMCGSNEVTRTLLKLGQDPNVQGYNALTPIYRATEINDVEAMKDLYEKGSDIYVKSGPMKNSLLHVACQKGHMEAAAWLLTNDQAAELLHARNDKSITPLHYCAQNGHLNMTRMLIDHGASIHSRDLEGDTVLHYAAKKGKTQVVKYLIEIGATVLATTNFGVTPLHRAAEFGHVEIIKALLNKGASVNANMNVLGASPLHLAIFNLSAVKVLINNGADVNLKTYSGETPLHWAASGAANAQAQVLQELIDRGSDVNSQMRNGWTPLHIACLHGLHTNIATFIENGANINEKDANGRVPLHFIAALGDTNVLKLMLQKGAKLDVKDTDGETPLDWAKNCGHTKLINALNSSNTNNRN